MIDCPARKVEKMNPIIDHRGNKKWFNENYELHRLNGPACELYNGDKSWWVNGKRHRLDGPAMVFINGSKSWWVNGKRHRINDPAIELANGSKSWYENGKRHRLDGPAIEDVYGVKSWYVGDKKLSEDLHTKLTGDIKDLPLYLGLGWDDYISERLK